jgi:hypothetical protein
MAHRFHRFSPHLRVLASAVAVSAFADHLVSCYLSGREDGSTKPDCSGTRFRMQHLFPFLASPSVAQAEQQPTAAVSRRKLTQKRPAVAVSNEHRKTEFDFIIVGYGNAGRAAYESLRQQCPTASIAVLDPLVSSFSGEYHDDDDASFWNARAIGLQSGNHVVETDAGDSHHLRYRHAVLIATGARGAPPPIYLLDEHASERIYELRPTIVPTSHRPSQRPILSRQKVLEIVEQQRRNVTIGVLGSGWEALDIVALACRNTSRHRNKPVLIFGSYGPLCHVVPSYLSSAISKRLKSKHVTVLDRSLVKYVSSTSNKPSSSSKAPTSQLRVYTAKSFDFLDGGTSTVDMIVIAPEIHGSRGSAAMPTYEIPEWLDTSAKGRSWYQTWSDLSVMNMEEDTASVVCYKDDGKIAVNQELCACSGVYAAGSVGKCANPITGHAIVSGAGAEDAKSAGRVAATNMARLFYTSNSGRLFRFGAEAPKNRFLSSQPSIKDPLPVWRSDRLFSEDRVSCLHSIGITALCVGNCDSESLNTHAVWWTNQSAQRRLLKLVEENDDLGRGDTNDAATTNRQLQQRREIESSLKPVYGMGVVYYLDRLGRIHGVMTWGLPYTIDGRELNTLQVDQMKEVIKTNGGLRGLVTELDAIRMSNYLDITSKTLVETAFAAQTKAKGKPHNLDGALESFPRPLHRYTEIRPPSVRITSVLKRKDGERFGILGEDLFARLENDNIPEPLPREPRSVNAGSAAGKVQAMHEWSVWEQTEGRWEENENRARPPLEDPLWIRKGDETRNIARRERVAAAYQNIINV